MNAGLTDEIEHAAERENTDHLRASIKALQEQQNIILRHVQPLPELLRAAENKRREAADAHSHLEHEVRDLTRRVKRIERFHGIDDDDLGPEQQRRPGERSAPAQAVRAMVSAWPRMMVGGGAFLALVMLATAAATLVVSGQWGAAELRTILPW